MNQPNLKTHLLEHSKAKVALYGLYLEKYLNILSRTSFVERVFIKEWARYLFTTENTEFAEIFSVFSVHSVVKALDKPATLDTSHRFL